MLQQTGKIAQAARLEVEFILTLIDTVIEASYRVIGGGISVLDGLMFIRNISGIFQPIRNRHGDARKYYENETSYGFHQLSQYPSESSGSAEHFW